MVFYWVMMRVFLGCQNKSYYNTRLCMIYNEKKEIVAVVVPSYYEVHEELNREDNMLLGTKHTEKKIYNIIQRLLYYFRVIMYSFNYI